MPKITNKIFISILLIVFSAIILGTTTYAWFTLNNTNKVESFSATVTAGEGLDMSLDGINWFTNLSTEHINGYLFNGYDIESTHYPPQYPSFKYQANTSVDGKTIKGYDDSAASGYIQFNLKIRTKNSEKLVIYWKEATLFSTGKLWSCDVSSFVNAKGETITSDSGAIRYYAADSTRISVIKAGSSDSPIIYELPTSASNTELGSLDAADLTNAYGAVNYYHVKTGDYPLRVEEVSVPAAVTTQDAPGGASLLSLTQEGQYYVGTVTIRIWVEGWDPDCLNFVLGDALTVGLAFEARAS